MIIYTNIILNITDIRHNISLFICYSMIYDFTYRHKADIILTYYRHKTDIITVFWYQETLIMPALMGANGRMRLNNLQH